MIIKKMPVLQGFPDPANLRLLSRPFSGSGDFQPVFYDIETTGLSRTSTFLYLIGAAAIEDGSWQLCQWMAEKPEEEPAVLKAFSEFLSPYNSIVSYNGDHFDKPYLEARGALYGLSSLFDGKVSLDLYLQLKPLKKLLKLPQMKQPDLEDFLGVSKRVCCDGRECIRLYKDFLKNHDSMTAETVLGHNMEDVLGLGRIFSMLGYLELCNGNYK